MGKRWLVGLGAVAVVGLAVLAGVGITRTTGNSKRVEATQPVEDRRFEKLAQFLLFDDLQSALGGAESVFSKEEAMHVFGVGMAVSAQKLSADYEANEVAADQKYKGAPLLITGTVSGIRKDFVDAPYVSLIGDGYLHDVQASFGTKTDGTLAKLSKGQKMVIVCEVGEQIVTEVMLKNCIPVNDFTLEHRSAANSYIDQVVSGKAQINQKNAELVGDLYEVAHLLPQQSGCFTEDEKACQADMEQFAKSTDKAQKQKIQAEANAFIAKLNVR